MSLCESHPFMLFQGCKIESTKKATCKLKITNLDAHFTSLIIRTCSTNPQIISYWCTSKICTGKMVPGITLIACYPVYIFHGILAFTTHAIIFRFWSGSEKVLKRFSKGNNNSNLYHECVLHVCTFSCYWIRYSLWRDCLPGCNAVTLLLPLLKRLKQLLNRMIVFYIIICTNQMFFLPFANVPHGLTTFPDLHLSGFPVLSNHIVRIS